MSLINDALLKAAHDRAHTTIDDTSLYPLVQSRKSREKQNRRSLGSMLANAAVFGALFAAVLVLIDRQRTLQLQSETAADDPPPALAERLDPGFGSPVAEPAPESTGLDSPPAPPPTPGFATYPASTSSPFIAHVQAAEEPAPSTPSHDYALAGMSMLGNDTLLGILRQSDRRSIWVPVGKSVGGITAVSYDPARDEAVIRVRGRLLTVTMSSGAMSGEEPAAHTAE